MSLTFSAAVCAFRDLAADWADLSGRWHRTPQVCEDCPNVKYERETEFLRIHVEPGMMHGQQINQFEEGEPLIDGEPGDLIVRPPPPAHYCIATVSYTTSILFPMCISEIMRYSGCGSHVWNLVT